MDTKKQIRASDKVSIFPTMTTCKAKAKPHAEFACAKIEGEINIFQMKNKLVNGKPTIERTRAAVSDENFNMNFTVN